MNEAVQTYLDKLIEEVTHLPGLEARESILARLKSIDTRVDETLSAFRQAKLTSEALKTLGFEGAAPDIREHASRIRSAAQGLRSFIEAGRISPTSKKDEEYTITLREAADEMRQQAARAWTGQLEGRAEAYRALASAADKARLRGAPNLVKAATRLVEFAKGAPTDSQAVKAAADALGTVRASIDALGLQGRPGQFVTSALKGEATVAMLLDSEVKQFLDVHPDLVPMLRIRLV